jgi:uncharacterized protein
MSKCKRRRIPRLNAKALVAPLIGTVVLFIPVLATSCAHSGARRDGATEGLKRVPGCQNGSGGECVALARALLSESLDPERLAQMRELLEYGCNMSSPEACGELGWMDIFGIGGPIRQRRGAKLIEQACDGEQGTWCVRLGMLYWDGTGVERNQRHALQLWEAMCEKGELSGCSSQLTIRILTGEVRPEDAEAELHIYCKRGVVGACISLAAMHLNAQLSHDVARALALYRDACDAKELPDFHPAAGEACALLGQFVESYPDASRDMPSPSTSYEKGCLLGAEVACGHWGDWMVRQGRHNKGWQLLQDACLRGDKPSCLKLGDHLLLRESSERDLKDAVKFFDRGCRLRDGEACGRLSVVYREGLMEEVDDSLAAAYAEMSCRYQHNLGCRDYGDRLRRGEGVEKDLEASRHIFSTGCELGDAESCIEFAEMVVADGSAQEAPARALDALKRACDLGSELGCGRAAKLLSSGPPELRDRKLAEDLLHRACGGGYQESCEELQ